MKKNTHFNKNASKLIFFILVISLIAIIVFSVNRVLVPLGIAYILSLIIKPIKKKLILASVTKRVLIILFITISIVVFTLPFTMAINSISDEVVKLEYYIPKLETYLRIKFDIFQDFIFTKFNYQLDVNPVDRLFELAESTTKSVFVYLPKVLGSLLEWGFIIPLFLYFILRDSRKLTRNILKIVPNNIV
jgi:putative permease